MHSLDLRVLYEKPEEEGKQSTTTIEVSFPYDRPSGTEHCLITDGQGQLFFYCWMRDALSSALTNRLPSLTEVSFVLLRIACRQWPAPRAEQCIAVRTTTFTCSQACAASETGNKSSRRSGQTTRHILRSCSCTSRGTSPKVSALICRPSLPGSSDVNSCAFARTAARDVCYLICGR